MNILLVEDNEIGRIVVEGYLSHEGHKVTLAKNGFEALALAENHFDIILMDIEMPIKNGFETSLEIRKSLNSNNKYRHVCTYFSRGG